MNINMDIDSAMKKMGFAAGNKDGKGKTPILPQKEDFSDWSQLAELILEAEIKDEIATGVMNTRAVLEWERTPVAERAENCILPVPISNAMKTLALKVATEVEMLLEIRDSLDPDMWQTKKLERVVRQEQIRNRLSDYAELEYIGIRKLIEWADSGKISNVGEMIAVTHLASKMGHLTNLRSGDSQMNNQSGSGNSSIEIQLNQINSSSPNGDLPGPGSLGSMQLRISHRVRSQMEAALPEHGSGGESFLDGIEMLTAKEVQKDLLTLDLNKESDE